MLKCRRIIYFLSLECPSNCLVCDNDDNDVCLVCRDGYSYTATAGECTRKYSLSYLCIRKSNVTKIYY